MSNKNPGMHDRPRHCPICSPDIERNITYIMGRCGGELEKGGKLGPGASPADIE